MEKNEFIKVYKEYWETLEKNQYPMDLISYDWIQLPESIPIEWMMYSQYLQEHARELANTINDLAIKTRQLSIWDKVLANHDEDENLYIVSEFVEPLATISLNLPYAIRGRIIFSVTHLCHQANKVKVKDWKDCLAKDNSIDFKVMEKVSANWVEYSELRKALNYLSNNDFSDKVYNFRNKYHHRYPPRIEFGQSQMVARNVENGKVSYGFGFVPPLEVNKLIPLLESQHKVAFDVFSRYKSLVNEHISTIFNT